MPKKSVLILFAILLSSSLKAEFVFNENCIKAYNSILSLKLNEGNQFIAAEKKQHPNNKIPYLLENYSEFLKVLTSETNASFEQFKVNKSKRIDIIESAEENPWYLYSLAEINLQSCINRFKYQEFVTGAYELQKAYKLLEENKKKYPSFLPNDKSFALLYGLIGMVPEQYKWALSSIGLKGNVQEGIEMLESLKLKLPNSSYSYLQTESIFFLSFIQMSLESKSNVFETVMKNTANIPSSSLMKTYICAVVASRTGHNDEAIEILSNRPRGAAYTPFYHLDYLLGLAKLNRFDEDAVSYFESYLKNYTGNFNIKDAYLKIAWYHLLNGNIDKYKAYTSLSKVRGQAISEKDKEAMNQASETHAPEINLLKARLYYDGGYYSKALDAIKEKKLENIPLTKDKLEYLYRMGRIFQAMSKDDQAIVFYIAAMNKGEELTYYYAANSALQLGFIYEKKKQFDKAAMYYSKATKMKNTEYKNSIESKAKAGQKRVSR
jgi:hypothetical protein